MADDHDDSHDPHYEPIITLPDVPVDTQTYEEDEDELIKLRAKLFRFDASESPGEWKERGTGEVKLLKHKVTSRVRIVMRRDKTHKMCANHYVTDAMNLIPSAGSERAWVWHTNADFADGEIKEERLAIRFANAENAQKFKVHFSEGKSSYKTGPNGDAKIDPAKKDDSDDSETEKDDETGEKSPVEATNETKEDTAADDVASQLEKVQISADESSEKEKDDESKEDAKPEVEPESKPEEKTEAET